MSNLEFRSVTINGRPAMVGNSAVIINSVTPPEPTPTVPSDMDFIYFAKDLTATSIPNSAINSTFGDYMKSGTLTINDTGANTYLTNANGSGNFLYKDLTTAQLDSMKAINSTYTYFIRCMQTSGDTGMGGILSWRYNNGGNNTYIYMIRAYQQQLQIHTTTGNQCGSNFSLSTDRVYKVVINGSSFKAYNLDNNAEYSLTYSTNRSMGSQMRTFWAGIDEYNLSRFYALAGIPRATTSEEDEIIKTAMMNQSL